MRYSRSSGLAHHCVKVGLRSRLRLPSRVCLLTCRTTVIAQGHAVSNVLQFDDRRGRWLSEHRDDAQESTNFREAVSY